MRPTNVRKLTTIAVLATALLLAACGGGGGNSGPSSHAPQISDLHLQQAVNSCCGVIRADMNSFDPDADLFGGTIVIETNLGTISGPIATCAAGCNPASTTNNVFAIFRYRGRGIFVSGQTYVIDRAGNQSNRLTFSFVSEGKAGATDAPSLEFEDAGTKK